MQPNNKLQSLRLPTIVMKDFMHLSNIYINTDNVFLTTVTMALPLKALQKRFIFILFYCVPIIKHLKTDRVQITSFTYIKKNTIFLSRDVEKILIKIKSGMIETTEIT